MLTIDGSYNEGGGQILRTALTLSLATGTPFCIEKIRAGRQRPGLLRQHLAAVKAAAAVGNAQVQGDEINSQSLTFAPRDVTAGDYHCSIGTAGSTTLVLQTVLPVLLSRHSQTNIDTIAKFLPARIGVRAECNRSCTVEVKNGVME
jgi:RNA 3'-terminal phosphate cyclase (ATP)